MIYGRHWGGAAVLVSSTGIRVKQRGGKSLPERSPTCVLQKVTNQSPVPGSGEKYFSNLPSTPSNSLASAGESFFWVIFGQALANSELTSSHFSRAGSVSGLIASAGHSGSHTPQSMHSSGWMTSMFSPS